VLALREYAIAFHLAARRTSDCQLPADGADESVDDEKKPGEPTTQLFRDLPILKSRRQAPKRERDRSRWDRAVAVGGILQGLLDFQRVEEQRLKAARLEERRLSLRQSAPRWPPRRRWKELESIEDTQNGLGELAGLLSQHLPNVFHYPSERRL
jgi:hypothetical protein